MREQLAQYVTLLFAGSADSEDMQQEILQNTLDRYDDLLTQGKTPEAAYRLAISGIGDISELLGSAIPQAAAPAPVFAAPAALETQKRPLWKKIASAIAISLYIICAIPLIILSEMGMEIIGLCATLSIAAVATVAIILAGDDVKSRKKSESSEPQTPQQKLRKTVKKIINTVGLVIYFIISFASGAWHITWLVFPIAAAVRELVFACLDIKEAKPHEN